MFSADKHASLQNADGVHTQVRGWLNQIDLGDFLAMNPERVAVDTAEVHQAGQSVSVRITPSGPLSNLDASLAWVGGPKEPAAPVEVVNLSPVERPTDIEFSAKDPGVYRVRLDCPEAE